MLMTPDAFLFSGFLGCGWSKVVGFLSTCVIWRFEIQLSTGSVVPVDTSQLLPGVRITSSGRRWRGCSPAVALAKLHLPTGCGGGCPWQGRSLLPSWQPLGSWHNHRVVSGTDFLQAPLSLPQVGLGAF